MLMVCSTALHNSIQMESSVLICFRDFAKSNTLTFPKSPQASGIDHLFGITDISKDRISYIYNLLLTVTPPVLHKIKRGWETELDITFSNVW